ncbi:MAG: adenylate/guanylate cyclase domain-containing protein [Dongiaceae bacterium]
MAEERVQRRLAAILAADVVGYGRLMEADEASTLAALKARRREVLDPLVAKHQGRVFKTTGDGMLVEFASAVNAVQCAVDLQHGMAVANASQPEDRHIILRIGVNLGDVMVEGGDLYGDGVNIAARLEAIAEPGGILVSGTAYDYVGNKAKVAFDDLGTQTLKNIAQPVRAYRVIGTPMVAVAATKPVSDKPSIAVLPFTNMSGDPEQEYFSDGITEDIITELSRFRELSILARDSAFRFRGRAVDVKQAGRELDVQYLVEGSVRRVGERLRITAQLIDAVSGDHVWAEHFDRDQRDFFAVQDQLVRTIVGTLVGRVHAVGAVLAGRKPPANLAAYECVLRGKALPLGDSLSEAERRRWFEKAIELDPGYGQAYAWLAHALSIEWFQDMSGSSTTLERAFELATKAMTLDPNDGDCVTTLGWIHLHRRSFELAEQYYTQALNLNRSDPEQHASLGILYTFLGRPNDALASFAQAKSLDPYFQPAWYWHLLGTAYFIACRFDEAIVAFHHSTTMPVWVRAYLAACHAQLGQPERARELADEVRRRKPDFSALRYIAKEPLRRPEDQRLLLDGFRKAGLPE